MLLARWEALIDIAKAEEATYQTGVAHNRYEREAWCNILTIGANVDPMEVVEVVLAIYLLQVETPRRLKSYDAFGAQLVRRARSLAPVSVGSYFDNEARKVRSVYRDAKPKTSAILARLLQETFGVAGLTIAHLERHEAQKAKDEKQALYDALGELT